MVEYPIPINDPDQSGPAMPMITQWPQPGDWDYRRHSGAMSVVWMVVASLFLWAMSGLLFWGMIAASVAAGGGSFNYYTGRYEDNSAMIIPGIIALTLGVLCWLGAAYTSVHAIYRILEFHAELSAIEIVRRWRAATNPSGDNPC